jgi:hypothetical protein
MQNILALALSVFKRRYLKFFLLVAIATRVLHGIKFFEQFLKVTTKGTFL